MVTGPTTIVVWAIVPAHSIVKLDSKDYTTGVGVTDTLAGPVAARHRAGHVELPDFEVPVAA